MPSRDIQLPDFQEMVRLYQQGQLDALLDEKNREFMAAVPEGSKRRQELERLQFQIRGLRARHQGLGRVMALSRLMHASFEQLNDSLHFPSRLVKQPEAVPHLQLVRGDVSCTAQEAGERENR
ncbi:DUF3135 domain-containing protein [Marinospirillum alkaliphilum]|uniref:DUF3135 domain-containing protein n=1 Tax=Marinospirillum alkaliphilum DSM 21637 TaxID=1122209 RepID=A0A1K1X381_9GAMM|nr:DUF3135 domain-containing protein [Marinospirillum alkaliphilum]SFX44098.1 Protein of unknown function [Marinospirillum alkaliphilum DSM 21637]